jgi:UDP-N-acetylmuramate--alanine ligase
LHKNALYKTLKELGHVIRQGGKNIHFIGVGGAGMYPLFYAVRSLSNKVTGSDTGDGELLLKLLSRGEEVYRRHAPENLIGKDIVVYTSAVKEDNAELVYAREHKIPAISRAELLGALITAYSTSIGVSGTHGKSTVTAMLYHVLKGAGQPIDAISGANLFSENEPYALSNNSTKLVYEACEYRDSFLNFFPKLALFLNLELEHTDYFKNLESLEKSFLSAMNNCDTAIVNADCESLYRLSQKTQAKIVLAGSASYCKYRLAQISKNSGKYSFSVVEDGGRVTKIALNIYGKFNVYNALLAFAAAREAGVDADRAKYFTEEFSGIARRLEYIGKYENHRVYYDYAHHPREISEGIRAITERDGSPIVIFRPHTFSRTQSLLLDFAKALRMSKRALLLDIDGIREENDTGISSEILSKETGNGAIRVTKNELLDHIDASNSPIIVMGAADMREILKVLNLGV